MQEKIGELKNKKDGRRSSPRGRRRSRAEEN